MLQVHLVKTTPGGLMTHPTLLPAIDLLSVAIVARDEQDSLPALLRDLTAQDFPKQQTEVLLIDSMSSDETLLIMEQFRELQTGYHKVVVLQNHNKLIPHGHNLALQEYGGDALIKIDAHATVSPDFLRNSVAALNDGQYVAGGRRETLLRRDGAWKQVLLSAENSIFGSGGASYRRKQQPGYVKSVFFMAARREVFARVGSYDERLLRTEDNDISYRIRQAGYQIYFDPEILSFQYIRSTLPAFLRQKATNGYWIGRTLLIQPGCIGLFNLVPAIFCLAIIAAVVLGLFANWLPLVLLACAYLIACVIGTALSIKAQPQTNWRNLALPPLFLAMHLGYGLGTITGIIRGLFRNTA
jgi:GT2 family glycosyltransferase